MVNLDIDEGSLGQAICLFFVPREVGGKFTLKQQERGIKTARIKPCINNQYCT